MPHPTFEMQFQAQFNLSWLWCSSCIEKQTVKRDKDTCIDMMEQIQGLLTLHQVHSFMEAHQDKGKIRLLFRQGEMSALLKAADWDLTRRSRCSRQVQGIHLQQNAQKTHEEVLDLIESISDATSSDGTSILEFPVTIAVGTKDIPRS
ncbi:hypothetical protein DFH09DRAFT_1079594 [Mycena vulgaris]|nr:hypothetical protein DFH09DRAFT_1079594 [Mycena vulgaris]